MAFLYFFTYQCYNYVYRYYRQCLLYLHHHKGGIIMRPTPYSVVDQLLCIAEEGQTVAKLALCEDEINDLRKRGFTVTELAQETQSRGKSKWCRLIFWREPTREESKHDCLISWKEPTMEVCTAANLLRIAMNPPF